MDTEKKVALSLLLSFSAGGVPTSMSFIFEFYTALRALFSCQWFALCKHFISSSSSTFLFVSVVMLVVALSYCCV